MAPREDVFRKIRTLADDLIATGDPSTFFAQVEGLTLFETSVLDSMVFECESCNQWYAIEDKPANSICSMCAEQDDGT